MRAIGYCRVSTNEQGDSGLGLEAQEATVRAEVARRDWTLERVAVDVASGKSFRGRDQFSDALRRLKEGEADVLVVSKLDRLSRSVSDFASVLALSHQEGWALDICDLGVDTTTPSGKMVAQFMMVVAEWEREIIGDRTRSALEQARARGAALGRPRGVDAETVRLIRVLRDSGASYQGVADVLVREGVPTAQGGEWRASTVRKLYRREASA